MTSTPISRTDAPTFETRTFVTLAGTLVSLARAPVKLTAPFVRYVGAPVTLDTVVDSRDGHARLACWDASRRDGPASRRSARSGHARPVRLSAEPPGLSS
jgi:hypothetical protein